MRWAAAAATVLPLAAAVGAVVRIADRMTLEGGRQVVHWLHARCRARWMSRPQMRIWWEDRRDLQATPRERERENAINS
jgi:hypothetical protein